MQLLKPEVLADFIEAFNEAKTPSERYAYAAAAREEVARYVETLDGTILPLYQSACAREVREARDKKTKK